MSTSYDFETQENKLLGWLMFSLFYGTPTLILVAWGISAVE